MPSPRPATGNSLRPLLRDPILWIFALAELLVIAPYFAPYFGLGTTARGMEIYGDLYATLPLKLLAVVAFLERRRPGRSSAERRFWKLAASAYGVWILLDTLTIALPDDLYFDVLTDRVQDLFYVGFYVLFALAIEQQPHEGSNRSGNARLRGFRSAGAIVFAAGLLVYFAVLPREVEDTGFMQFIPSMLLYVIMDAYILTRLIAVRLGCRDVGWRRVYGALIVTATLWASLDVTEALMYHDILAWTPAGTRLDLVWHLPYVSVVLAARLREVPSPVNEEPPRQPELPGTRGGALILYAVAFPLIHFAVSAAGISDPQTRALREVFVVVVVLFLAALALLYQRSLDVENRRLQKLNRAVTDTLQLSQRMEAVGRLAGGIAHDFNNVLQVVRGCSDLVQNKLDADSPHSKELNLIGAAVDRARALTDQLLTVSRRKKNDAQALSLNEVVSETAAMLRRTIGGDIVLSLDADPALPYVHADRGELEQVIMNLGVNARDAMPGGGVLELRTVAANEAGAGRYSTLIVRDSGHGMDEETKAHMFEPFFSTKPFHSTQGVERGSGLGLSIVYAIVTRAGGHVDVESVVGEGTTFRIYLPHCPAPAIEERPPAPIAAEPSGGAESILVVEDEDGVRELMIELLEELGYLVVAAADAEEALRAFDARPEPFDLLLTDVVMPGMKGPELAHAVRERSPGTGVLFMSGYVGDSLDPDGGGQPTPLLRKPFTQESLAAGVRRALDAGRG